MTISEATIFNMALSYVGGNQINTVQDADEDSPEALFCRIHYDTVRQRTLSKFQWGFASKIAEMDLIPEAGSTLYPYRYQIPVDCLFPSRVTPNFASNTRVNYIILGNEINCAVKPAYLEYVSDFSDTSSMPSYFVESLAYGLAAKIAIATRNDPDLATLMSQYYDASLASAVTTDRQKYYPVQSESPWVVAFKGGFCNRW